MAAITRDYEISIWDLYQGKDGKEEKKCVIGSDKMEFAGRAIDPVLTKNINGNHTLTFKLYDQYFDNFTQKKAINPFVSLLPVETCVKLYYKNSWYDFIITNRQENSEQNLYTYTAKSLHIQELSKSGFNLEFHSELGNNQGTIFDLATKVLDGSGWTVDRKKSDVIRSYVDDNLFYVPVSNGLTPEKILSTGTITVTSQDALFVFSSDNTQGIVLTNALKGYTGSDDAAKKLRYIEEQIYKQKKYSPNGLLDRSEYTNVKTPKTITKDNFSDFFQFRAERLVEANVTEYNPVLKKWVTKYKDSNYRSYEKTEFQTGSTVVDLMVNGKNFTSTAGWRTDLAKTDSKVELVSDPPFGSGFIDKEHISQLRFTLNNTGYENHLFHQNKRIINEIVKGDKYIVEFEVERDKNNNRLLDFDIRYNKQSCITKGAWNNNSIVVTFSRSFSNNELDNVYFWIEKGSNVSDDVKTGNLIQTSLYKKVAKNNNSWYRPGEVVESKTISTTYYYDAVKMKDVLNADEYVYENPTELTALTNNHEKITSIEKKESNRFNLIQELCEKFGCWAIFEIAHDKSGAIINNGRKVVFKEFVGDVKYAGFRYGVNLKQIQRTIVSDQIATKIIVKPNKNEHGKSGFCAISRSKYNPILSDYILNFDYFIQKNLISSSSFLKDLKDFQSDLYAKRKREKEITEKYLEDVAWFTDGNRQRTEALEICQASIDKIIEYFNDYRSIASSSLGTSEYTSGFYTEGGEIYFPIIPFQDISTAVDSNKIEYINDARLVYTAYADVTYKLLINELSEKQEMINIANGINNKNPYSILDIGFSLVIYVLYAANWNEKTYYQLNSDNELEAITDKQKLSENCPYPTKPLELFNKGYQTYTNYFAKVQSALEILRENYDIFIEYQNFTDKRGKEIKDKYKKDIANLKIKDLEDNFFNKYRYLIKEGSWVSEEYFDDDEYYAAALNVARTSSKPKLTYNISVIDVSGLDGYNQFSVEVGDKTYIEDTEFFGYIEYLDSDSKTIKQPYQEEVIVMETVEHLEAPEQNQIKVQNYKTRFEDLFQKITATSQQLQFATGGYNRASAAITDDGTLNGNLIQNSILKSLVYMQNPGNSTIRWDKNGIQIIQKSNTNRRIKLSNGMIALTKDGTSWTTGIDADGINANLLTVGIINTGSIILGDKDNFAFRWDKHGLNAYSSNNNKYDFSKFVRFDQYGLYGYSKGEEFFPQSLSEIEEGADFGLTWDGFFIKSEHKDKGRLKISKKDDLQILVPNGQGTLTERLKIGLLNPNESIDDYHYGIRLTNKNGTKTFATDKDGNLEITGNITALSGKIGGWEISGNKLHSTSNDTTGIWLNAEESTIYSQQYVNSSGGDGWKITDKEAIFNNITLRGALKCAVLEYGEVQAVGGILMVRPSTTIKKKIIYENLPPNATETDVSEKFMEKVGLLRRRVVVGTYPINNVRTKVRGTIVYNSETDTAADLNLTHEWKDEVWEDLNPQITVEHYITNTDFIQSGYEYSGIELVNLTHQEFYTGILILQVEKPDLFRPGDVIKLTTEADGDIIKKTADGKTLLYSGINTNLFKCKGVYYSQVDQNVEEYKPVVILEVRDSDYEGNIENLNLEGMGLVDLGQPGTTERTGSITIALNSSTNNAMVPATTFSVSTLEKSTDTAPNWYYLQPHILLGKIPNDSHLYGTVAGKYGLYADAVHLTGHIHAQTGSIGGWEINGQKLYATGETGKVCTVQAPSKNTNWVFAAGGTTHSSYNNCPFKVDKNGNLYASSAEITGKITATSGSIGNWLLGSYKDNNYTTSCLASTLSNFCLLDVGGEEKNKDNIVNYYKKTPYISINAWQPLQFNRSFTEYLYAEQTAGTAITYGYPPTPPSIDGVEVSSVSKYSNINSIAAALTTVYLELENLQRLNNIFQNEQELSPLSQSLYYIVQGSNTNRINKFFSPAFKFQHTLTKTKQNTTKVKISFKLQSSQNNASYVDCNNIASLGLQFGVFIFKPGNNMNTQELKTFGDNAKKYISNSSFIYNSISKCFEIIIDFKVANDASSFSEIDGFSIFISSNKDNNSQYRLKYYDIYYQELSELYPFNFVNDQLVSKNSILSKITLTQNSPLTIKVQPGSAFGNNFKTIGFKTMKENITLTVDITQATWGVYDNIIVNGAVEANSVQASSIAVNGAVEAKELHLSNNRGKNFYISKAQNPDYLDPSNLQDSGNNLVICATTISGEGPRYLKFALKNPDGLLIQALQINYNQNTNEAVGSLNGTWTGTSGGAITSDRNKKNTITAIESSYSTFYDKLKPVTYKYNDGTSDRLHTGFIAQDVEQALSESNISTQNFAGFVEVEGIYYLRYEEFIALNTNEIQKLKKRVSELEQQLSQLQNTN